MFSYNMQSSNLNLIQMTGNVALDVFISLIFVYLLYSLMATVLMEMWSSRFRLRARNLKYTIIRMLSDEDFTITQRIKYFWWLKFFPKEKDDESCSLAKSFYSAPTIKFLSKKSGDLPSSINSDTFSKTMIYILSEGAAGTMESIESKLSSLNGDPETVKHIKYLSQQADTKDGLEGFEELLKSWYEEMMERCLGWYKKRVQVVLFIFGFLIASTFNLNSLYLVKILTHDNKARDAIVKMAGDYVEATSQINNDSLKRVSYEELKKTHTALKIQSQASTDLLGLKPLPQLIEYEVMSWADFVELKPAPLSYDFLYENNPTKVVVYEQPEGWSYLNLQPYVESVTINPAGGSVPFDASLFYWSYSFWGYLITALAISLGAPFWFDLLNKLMLLRSSITKNGTTSSKVNSIKE